MDERKTKETHKNVVGKLRVLRAVNKKLYSVELWLLNNIRNRNGWLYENLEEHLSEVEDIPILTAYLRNGQVIGDGHNYDLRRGKDGKEYASFTAADAERIVGWIPKDSNIRLETDENSVPWIVADGYLWRWYAPELVDKIAGQGGMEVSIETLIHQERTEGNTEIEERYTILGVTVLGDGVAPAVAGASIKSLAEMREGMKNEILKAASYIGETDEPQAATQKDPKRNAKERMRNTMIPTMRQLQEAGKAFEGYTCVGLSEDGKTVALLSAQNAPFGYVFTDSDQGNVIPERIKAANAIVTFTTEDGETSSALDNVIAPLTAKLNETEQANETLKSENKRLSERLEAMEKREKARRLQAAKDAATAALDKFNANRDDDRKFNCDILNGLLSRIEAGEFTECEDKECNWTGDKLVANEVAVLCMAEQAKQDAAEKAKEKRQFRMPLDGAKNNAAGMTMGEKLAAMGSTGD